MRRVQPAEERTETVRLERLKSGRGIVRFMAKIPASHRVSARATEGSKTISLS